MALFTCYPFLLVILSMCLQVQAQYLDNREDPYMSPYVRHSPAANHRSVKQQPIDDLPSSQSLFMMDFKRQAIVIPENGEKLSKNSSNHTVIEKYIIDSNSPEYQQLLQKMVSVEKRPPFFLQANQAMASSRSTSISKADSEHELSSVSIGEKENAKSSVHSGLLKHSHKFLQSPYDTANYHHHHHLISSKMPMDLDKKESISSSSKYATVASDDKAHLFEDRLRGTLNGTLSEERLTLRRLQGQLRASLEALLVQLSDLRAAAEHEIKKLCHDESCRDHPSADAGEKSSQFFGKEYDHEQRGHHFNVHYVTKYSS